MKKITTNELMGKKNSKEKKEAKRKRLRMDESSSDQETMDVSDSNTYHKSEDELTPAFYWPVYSVEDYSVNVVEGDSFPDVLELDNSLAAAYVCEHSKSGYIQRLDPGLFWRELFNSHNVYIVDKFFSKKEFEFILDVVTNNRGFALKKLVIICSNDCRELRERKREKADQIKIELHVYDMYFNQWKLSLYNYFDILNNAAKDGQGDDDQGNRDDESLFNVHDRFAWMDGEIWHFGSTVGGIKPHVTAYSRGWYDHGDKFLKYIEKIIEKQKDQKRT